MTELTKEELLREIEDRLLFEIDVTLEKQGLRVMGEHQAAVTISCYTNALRLLREVFLDRHKTVAEISEDYARDCQGNKGWTP